ncbi:S41 family peptidase [bacterium]|nr:S41 family peptidase [bacterium]
MKDDIMKIIPKSIRKLLPITVVLITAMVLLTGPAACDAPAGKIDRREFLESLKILGSVYERVMYNYVDEVDAEELLEAGIKGMTDYLDEHTAYLPPSFYEDLQVKTDGEFGGLGISINTRDHFPTVISPIEGTPAFFMGIQGGDQIVEVEGESAYDFTTQDAIELLRGEPGTEVTITIAREGVDDFEVTIERAIIKVESVPYAFMIDDIGYIRIQNFSRTTADELHTKLDELALEKPRGLILDLRFNPGGLLSAACEVSDMFLDPKDLIVYTKGRLQSQNVQYFSEGSNVQLGDVPVIVLVNGSSASASEIVAAAIQDHDSGLVVGKTSFGKGSVQSVFRLSEDQALKLTTAKYYTPSGRSIHKDHLKDDSDFDLTALGMPEEVEVEEVNREDKEIFHTDSGRIVYGGGGVTPDIEIEQPIMSEFEFALERDTALFRFAHMWAVDHDVDSTFTTSNEMLSAFNEFLADREKLAEYLKVYEIAMTDSLLQANDEFMRRGLRREMLRKIDGAEAAYLVAIEKDEQLLETLELFKQAPSLDGLLALAAQWEADRVSKAEAESSDDSK